MTQHIPFADNVTDLSNQDGYQFEFRCERCGNGHRSAFQRDPRAGAQKIARGIGNLFGGQLANVGYMADRLLDRGTNSPAKDQALQAATLEIALKFHQCRGCGDWTCDDICWNASVGQCVRCSPIATEELAQLQSEARRRQIQDRLETVDLVGNAPLSQAAQPRCPACGAQSHGGKFCAQCGATLHATAHCRECSAQNPPAARYCVECGSGMNA